MVPVGAESIRVRRVGVLGDVHAEDELLRTALEHLEGEPVDAVLAVGDVVDGPGDADRCCELLQAARALIVRGNHERWLLDGEYRDLPDASEVSEASRAWLASLPRTLELETPAGRAMLCHAVGDDDTADVKPHSRGYDLQIPALRELIARDDLSFMMGGHTHQRMVRRLAGLTIINVGTLHRDFEPCFAIVDFERRLVQFQELQGGRVLEGPQHELPEPAALPAEPPAP